MYIDQWYPCSCTYLYHYHIEPHLHDPVSVSRRALIASHASGARTDDFTQTVLYRPEG